jgi:hypothetical protein
MADMETVRAPLAGVGRIAAVTSAAWAVQGLVSVALPDPSAALDISMIAPMSLTAIAVAALQRAGLLGSGTFGRGVAGYFGAAMILAIPGQVAMAFDLDKLMWLAFPTSVLTFVAGLVLSGIAVIRAGVAPRWIGGALIAAQVLTMAIGLALSPISPLVDSGDYTGALGHGLVWAMIAAALLGKRVPVFGFAPVHRPAAT